MIKCLKTENKQLCEELKFIEKPGKFLFSINCMLNSCYFPLKFNVFIWVLINTATFYFPPGKKSTFQKYHKNTLCKF